MEQSWLVQRGEILRIGSENGASNGSLVKYVNGNGVAAAVVDEIEVSKLKEEGRQRKIKEIGKEDAWFKQSGLPKVEEAVRRATAARKFIPVFMGIAFKNKIRCDKQVQRREKKNVKCLKEEDDNSMSLMV